jgi:hypothetical protein
LGLVGAVIGGITALAVRAIFGLLGGRKRQSRAPDYLPDYYTVLEVSRDASQEEIQSRYESLLHKYQAEPNERERIEQAFNLLGDPELRLQYDRELATQ